MSKGKITISRVNNFVGNHIEITIIDEASGTAFVEARLSMADFAGALTGLSHTECEIGTYHLDRVGKKREQKVESIPVDGRNAWNIKNDDAEIAKILAPYEIDGWIGSAYDTKNSKNYGQNHVRVSFERYVDA